MAKPLLPDDRRERINPPVAPPAAARTSQTQKEGEVPVFRIAPPGPEDSLC